MPLPGGEIRRLIYKSSSDRLLKLQLKSRYQIEDTSGSFSLYGINRLESQRLLPDEGHNPPVDIKFGQEERDKYPGGVSGSGQGEDGGPHGGLRGLGVVGGAGGVLKATRGAGDDFSEEEQGGQPGQSGQEESCDEERTGELGVTVR